MVLAISALLPYENVDVIPVPLFFRDLLALYLIFLGSNLWDASLPSPVDLHKHKPRVKRFSGKISVASMVSALAIVVYSAALWLP